GLADWITCFPGFGMLTADAPGAATPSAAPATSVVCGGLSAEPGVRIVWPDGETTVALTGAATGLGEA
nr:AIR synthase [Actinomycetota bacterium]